MLRVWATILFRPRKRLAEAAQARVSAPLKVAVLSVLGVNVLAVALGLAEGWLADRWVRPAAELGQDGVSPEAFWAITRSDLFLIYVVWMTNLGLFLTDLYARLWGVLWSVSVPAFNFAAKLYQDVAFDVREIGWLYEGRSVLLNPIYFVMGMGVRHGLAKALGGQGRFGRYAYLFMLFWVPLTLLSSLIYFVPLVGPGLEVSYLATYRDASTHFGQFWYHALDVVPVEMLRWLLSFFSIGLAYWATRAGHGLTWWRAIVVAVVGYVASFFIGNSLFYLLMGSLRAPQMLMGS